MKIFYFFALMFTLSLTSLPAFIAPHSVQHIKQRHWHNTNNANTSRFNKSMTVKKLDAIATRTIQKGSIQNSKHGQGRKTHQFKFNRPVGFDGQGNRSKTLRVVTDPNGQVITAFPV